MIHSLIGSIPAIILPLAAFLQLLRMVRNRSAEGVSPVSWALFGIANLCLFIYTDQIDIFIFLSFIGTAIIDFLIVGLCFVFGRRHKGI
jgi:uncharacterized protein with PQ loop repeat